MSEDGKASQARQPKYWLIVKHEVGGVNVLVIDLPSGEKALAVFSFEEEAELFLHHELSGTGWWVREAMIGELVSVLYGLCASVAKVALDPLPRNVSGGTNGLLSLRHDDFARVLVGERGPPRMALGRSSPLKFPGLTPLSGKEERRR